MIKELNAEKLPDIAGGEERASILYAGIELNSFLLMLLQAEELRTKYQACSSRSKCPAMMRMLIAPKKKKGRN